MSFKLKCPFCVSPLGLTDAPGKLIRVKCGVCKSVFPIDGQGSPTSDVQPCQAPGQVTENADVELVNSGNELTDHSGATSVFAKSGDDEESIDLPPERPISGVVVLTGLMATGAASLAAAGILDLGLSYLILSKLPPLVVAAVFAGGAFGGYFTASLADSRRIRHVLTGAIFALLFSIPGSILALRVRENSWRPGDPDVASADLVLTPGVLFISFIVGGFLERIVTWTARMLGTRKAWSYVTGDGRSVVAHGPWRHSKLAFFWKVVAIGFLLTCWIPAFVLPKLIDKLLELASFIFLAWVSAILARKRSALDAEEAFRQDARPPIIFLRSFSHDGRRVHEGLLYEYVFGAFSLFTGNSVEQQLASIMARFGPFTAIGKPGEELPEMGAARMYVEDDDWQVVVADLLKRRDAVALMQAGETEGLRWELNRVGKFLRPDRVLIFVPFGLWELPEGREELYREFRAWAQKCLGTKLPKKLGHSCFIYFTVDIAARSHASHTLERLGEIPAEHPLLDMLEAIQKDGSLWPRRGTVVTIWWGLAAIVLIFIMVLACIWLNPIGG